MIATPPHVSPDISGRRSRPAPRPLREARSPSRSRRPTSSSSEWTHRTGIFQVGFKNRFSPLIAGAAERVEGGPARRAARSSGSARSTRRYGRTTAAHRADTRLPRAGPPVVHEGAHAADLLDWLLGPPARVTATSRRSQPELPGAELPLRGDRVRRRLGGQARGGLVVPAHARGRGARLGPGGVADLSRPQATSAFHDGTSSRRSGATTDWQTVCFRGQLDGLHEAIEAAATGADARPDATRSGSRSQSSRRPRPGSPSLRVRMGDEDRRRPLHDRRRRVTHALGRRARPACSTARRRGRDRRASRPLPSRWLQPRGERARPRGLRTSSGAVDRLRDRQPWYGTRRRRAPPRAVETGLGRADAPPAAAGIHAGRHARRTPSRGSPSELGLPVYVGTGKPVQSLPLQLTEVARRFPKVNFMMGHMGHTDFWIEAIPAAAAVPNIYAECRTSSRT